MRPITCSPFLTSVQELSLPDYLKRAEERSRFPSLSDITSCLSLSAAFATAPRLLSLFIYTHMEARAYARCSRFRISLYPSMMRKLRVLDANMVRYQLRNLFLRISASFLHSRSNRHQYLGIFLLTFSSIDEQWQMR